MAHKHLPTNENLIRLVAVGLKEASTDTPCFRASIRYMDSAISVFTHSLREMADLLQRYTEISNEIQSLEEDFNILFDPMTKSDFSNEMVNKDIAAHCMESTAIGTNVTLRLARSVLYVNPEIFNKLQFFLETDIPQYLSLREQFQTIQKKYDTLLSNYLGLPKSNEPAKSKEDALQLYEIRKQYIHVSLTLWTTIKRLEIHLSSFLVELCGSLWPSAPGMAKVARNSVFPGLSNAYNSIIRLRECFSIQAASFQTLLSDLSKVKTTTEKGVTDLFAPSTELSDYDAAVLNGKNVYYDKTSKEAQQLEKHGWVFMKATFLNTHNPTWIQRWLFIKGDVFGFLSVSANGQYVEQSDCFGVQMADVQYFPDEDRKFCFEIKTQQFSLIFQVETLVELKSWLTVFRTVKAKAVENSSKYASARYECLIDRFRLIPVVDEDYNLVTIHSNNLQKVKFNNLINSQLSRVYPGLSINPPLVTQTTALSVLSHLYLSSGNIPGAATANFWGFVNWGLYYVTNASFKNDSSHSCSPKPILELRYPSSYPDALKLADAELRAIFEGHVKQDEFTLVHFKCSWSPNATQELFCNVYITNDAFYIYTNNCGLISVSRISFSSFLHSKVIHKNHYDLLRMYLVSGLSIKMKVFIGSAEEICEKINFVLLHQRSADSTGKDLREVNTELLKGVKKISRSYAKAAKLQSLNVGRHKSGIGATSNAMGSTEPNSDSNIDTGISTIVIPSQDKGKITEKGTNEEYPSPHTSYELLLQKDFPLPAKALFHILFGDKSSTLESLLTLSHPEKAYNNIQYTPWRCDSRQKLTRIVWGVKRLTGTLQCIERMVNNEYYLFTQTSPKLRIMFGILRRIVLRIEITGYGSHNCTMAVYYHLERRNKKVGYLVGLLLRRVLLYRVEEFCKRVSKFADSILDDSRKIASALREFGVVTKYDSDTKSKEEVAFSKQVTYISFKLFCTCYLERASFKASQAIRAFGHVITSVIVFISRVLNMELFWILLLGISMLFNLFLMGKTGFSYWQERNIRKYMDSLTNEPSYIQRAISLTEMEEIIQSPTTEISYNANKSLCFSQFAKTAKMPVSEFEPEDSNSEFLPLSTNLFELRVRRNDLLTEIKALNDLERNYIHKQWRDWVLEESKNCDHIKAKLPTKYDEQIQRYCESVGKEMMNISKKLL